MAFNEKPRVRRDPKSKDPRKSNRFGSDGEGPRRRFRKKLNRFYSVFSTGVPVVDYKDTEKLSKFITEKGKIIPRRITGLTSKQQRILARAIKMARHAGLLAFQVD